MKFKIVESRKSPDDELEVSLRLEKHGAVSMLVAGAHVITINKEGTLWRHSGVSEDIGLSVDANGRVRLAGE